MGIRQTHTFAILELTPAAFEEIKTKLAAAGYQHAFIEEDDKLVIDMHGIGVTAAMDKSIDYDSSGVRTSEDVRPQGS